MNDDRVGVPENLPGVVPPEVAKFQLKTHDEYGLSLDPKNWANEKCHQCGGRGIVISTTAVNASEMAPGAMGSGNTVTKADPCYAKRCAMVSYWKVREPLQFRIVQMWEDPNVSEEKKQAAIKSMIEEVHKQVKAAGTITDMATIVEVSKKAIESVIVRPNSVSMVKAPPPPRHRRK